MGWREGGRMGGGGDGTWPLDCILTPIPGLASPDPGSSWLYGLEPAIVRV